MSHLRFIWQRPCCVAFLWMAVRCIVYAQAIPYAAVDAHALHLPAQAATNVTTLAIQLTEPFELPHEKVRALYTWVTHNIAYQDNANMDNRLWSTPADLYRQRPEEVLRARTAVCLGYAQLFQSLATTAGLPSVVVSGIVKQPDGTVPALGHAWVAVSIQGQWRLLDPTWGALKNGRQTDAFEHYFLPDPVDFVQTHLPDDPAWQLLENPLYEAAFRTWSAERLRTWATTPAETPFHYRDTLQNWWQLDTLMRLQTATARTLRYHTDNDRIVFEMGLNYLQQFTNLYYTLDSLLGNTIFTDPNTPLDTVGLGRNIALLSKLYGATQQYFGQVRTSQYVERIEANQYWHGMNGLVDKLWGDVRMAQFRYAEQRYLDLSDEKQLKELEHWAESAIVHYQLAQQRLNCTKLPDFCRTLYERTAQLQWLLGVAHRRFLIGKTRDESWLRDHKPDFYRLAAASQSHLVAAERTFAQMPIAAQIGNTRLLELVQVREEQLRLGVMLVQYRADSLAQSVYSQKAAFSPAQANALAAAQQQLQSLADRIAQAPTNTYGEEARTDALRRLQFQQYLNRRATAFLWYRMALQTYNQAIENGTLPTQRQAVHTYGQASVETLQVARTLLRQLTFLTENARQQEQTVLQELHAQVKKILASVGQ